MQDLIPSLVELFTKHWKALLLLWFVASAIQTMPSPTDKGPTSSWVYKWVFGLLHSVFAAGPRVIYTLAPYNPVFAFLLKLLPFNGQTQPPSDPGTPSAQSPAGPAAKS